jgi:hypothetical protein
MKESNPGCYEQPGFSFGQAHERSLTHCGPIIPLTLLGCPFFFGCRCVLFPKSLCDKQFVDGPPAGCSFIFAGFVTGANATAATPANSKPANNSGAKPSAVINKAQKVARTIGTINEPTASVCF